MKRPRLTAFDRKHLTDENFGIAGVDEAGRGALAGPVVAAALLVGREFYESSACRRIRPFVRDSKTIPPEKREVTFDALEKCRDAGGIWFAEGVASVEEIEDHNILGATRIAMRRALDTVFDRCACPPECWENCGPADLFYDERKDSLIRRRPAILVDGRPLKPFFYPHTALVQGDGRSFAIAAASIVAKVTRDRLLIGASDRYPEYGFDSNKGYGTPAHVEALEQHGPTEYHRRKFLRKLIAAGAAEDEVTIPMFDDGEFQVIATE